MLTEWAKNATLDYLLFGVTSFADLRSRKETWWFNHIYNGFTHYYLRCFTTTFLLCPKVGQISDLSTSNYNFIFHQLFKLLRDVIMSIIKSFSGSALFANFKVSKIRLRDFCWI